MSATRKKLIIEITGEALDDLEVALDKVKCLVSEGYTSGADSNDTGDYDFTCYHYEALGNDIRPSFTPPQDS